MATSGKRRKAKRVARAKKGIKKQRKIVKETPSDAGPVSLAEAKAAKHCVYKWPGYFKTSNQFLEQ
jgi:hypothetical protein